MELWKPSFLELVREWPLSNVRYRNIIKQYQYKDDVHAVWYIVGSNSLLKKLTEYWKRYSEYSSKVQVYFSLLEEVINLKEEAKLIGLNATYSLREYFSIPVSPPAHAPAQRVVALNSLPHQMQSNLTSSIHTPFSENPN
jgi:hypothetical protein